MVQALCGNRIRRMCVWPTLEEGPRPLKEDDEVAHPRVLPEAISGVGECCNPEVEHFPEAWADVIGQIGLPDMLLGGG